MNSNLNQFSYYTLRILNDLSDKFPVPITLSPENLINDFSETSKKLNELEYKETVALQLKELLEELNSFDNTPISVENKKVENHLKKVKAEIASLTNEQKNQEEILKGTLLFLENEGYIRNIKKNTFSLSDKGFTQLKKQFKNANINDLNDYTFIGIIKDLVNNPDNFWRSVGNGLIINILSKFFSL